ncbi:LysR family transcriptional regulator [Roseibium sp.]|uniref:LysR family transcriptional regulator n=1 Tax=Roseibium sp. TaxID=1936156 RepID=UPI003D0A137F
MVNLTFVKSFVTVADTGSFQEAAKRLNLAQPTLSQHISKLEESLGVQLIERRRSGSQATPKGKSVLAVAKTLLWNADHMAKVVQQDVVRIGASANIADYYVAPRLSEAKFAHERNLHWEIEQADNPALVQWLKDGLIDIAITEWQPDEDGLQSRFWLSDEMVIILPANHPYAARRELSLTDLSDMSMIGGGRGTGTGSLLRNVLGPKADRLTASLSMGSTQAVKSAVASGMGYSIVLRESVETDLKAGSLAALKLKGYDLQKSFFLSVLMEKANDLAILRFMGRFLRHDQAR